MRLYPKVIPIISREVVQKLMQDGDVEVETLRIADAEMDMSAIMREYLANEERVNQATREALERRGYDFSKFNQVKREMADVRGLDAGSWTGSRMPSHCARRARGVIPRSGATSRALARPRALSR